jgi:23S rRNA-/tRNA-specific pseudouridylate synthase
MPIPWRERFAEGKVSLEDGLTLTAASPYRHGVTVLYSREVEKEPAGAEDATILFQDSDILVADKPHGMVVTPAGLHVERSLLAQLQRQTGLTTLAPGSPARPRDCRNRPCLPSMPKRADHTINYFPAAAFIASI